MNLTEILRAVHTAGGCVTDKLDEVTPGSAFVCVCGQRTDGHTLAARALGKGAEVLICERDLGLPQQVLVENTRTALAELCAGFYGNPGSRLRLVGVTGTNGKTTVATRIRDILAAQGFRSGVIGTLGVDDGESTHATGMTTPECRVLQENLLHMVEAGCAFAVAEVSSQALAQERCAGLTFETAVFTNLSPEHLDYHGSMEAYARAKAKLFASCRTAVLNADDPYFSQMAKSCAGELLTYSLRDNATYTAKNIQHKTEGVSYILVHGGQLARVFVPSPGVFSVYNSMAAIAAAQACGLPFEECCAAMSKCTAVPGRMERILPAAEFAVYVDYAHTPAALEAALQALRQTTRGRVLAVFGCGGDRDREKRPLMGAVAAALASQTILTTDNPRSESPQQILAEIADGFGKNRSALHIEPSREQAIALAMQMAKPGDSILLAGKGHEKTQIFADGIQPFDDIETAQRIFAAGE